MSRQVAQTITETLVNISVCIVEVDVHEIAFYSTRYDVSMCRFPVEEQIAFSTEREYLCFLIFVVFNIVKYLREALRETQQVYHVSSGTCEFLVLFLK